MSVTKLLSEDQKAIVGRLKLAADNLNNEIKTALRNGLVVQVEMESFHEVPSLPGMIVTVEIGLPMQKIV